MCKLIKSKNRQIEDSKFIFLLSISILVVFFTPTNSSAFQPYDCYTPEITLLSPDDDSKVIESPLLRWSAPFIRRSYLLNLFTLSESWNGNNENKPPIQFQDICSLQNQVSNTEKLQSDYRIIFFKDIQDRFTVPLQLLGGALPVELESVQLNIRAYKDGGDSEIPLAFELENQIDRTWERIIFLDQNLGWRAGGSGIVEKTENAGTTWQEIESVTVEKINDIYWTDNQKGWIVGNNGLLLRTTDEGQTWIRQSILGQVSINRVSFLNEDLGIIAGNQGFVMLTENGGDSWESVELPGPTRNFFDIAMLDPNRIWLAGSAGSIYYSSDGGGTWEIQDSGSFRMLRSIEISSDGKGIAAGNLGTVIYTEDFGMTWSIATSNTSAILNDIVKFNGDYMIAGENGTLLIFNTESKEVNNQDTGTSRNLRTVAIQPGADIWLAGEKKFVFRGMPGEGFNSLPIDYRMRYTIGQNNQVISDNLYLLDRKGEKIEWVVNFSTAIENMRIPSDGDVYARNYKFIRSDLPVYVDSYQVSGLAPNETYYWYISRQNMYEMEYSEIRSYQPLAIEDTYRQMEMNVNRLRLSYHNMGMAGRRLESNSHEQFLEYPTYTSRRYMSYAGLIIGAEVENMLNDESIPIIMLPSYRTNPETGKSWHFEPVPGYYREDTPLIATSDRPETWPEFWPDRLMDDDHPGWQGAWNGLLGKDNFRATREIYYRITDSAYTRYSMDGSFMPFPGDQSRGGLGLEVDTRILAWNLPGDDLDDIHFIIHDIYNTSDLDIDKATVGLWTADYVGNVNNNRVIINENDKTIFFTNISPLISPPPFQGTAIGVAAIRLLQTPLTDGGIEAGLTSLVEIPTGQLPVFSDQAIWNKLLPGQFIQSTDHINDTDQLIGSGIFNIPAKGHVRFSWAVTVAATKSNNIEIVDRKLTYAQAIYDDNFLTVPVSDKTPVEHPIDLELHQNYPNPFNPSTIIRFRLPIGQQVQLEVFDIVGRRVAVLVNGVLLGGSHEVNFNAVGLASGIYIYRLTGSEFSMSKKMLLVK